MTEKPLVLVGSPITEYKLYCTGQYLKGLKQLSYENKIIVLVDNSPTESVKEAIKNFNPGCKFFVFTTPFRTYARERLIEGRNLLRAIICKDTELDKFELSYEDKKNVEELQKLDFDYFFSLEQDVIPPTNTIELLMAENNDIIEGVYMNQKAVDVPVTHQTPQGPVQGVQQQTKFIPMAWTWADPDVKDVELLTDMTLDHLLPSRVQQVAAIGVGCGLIKKEVLDELNIEIKMERKYRKLLSQLKHDGADFEKMKSQIKILNKEIREEFLINNRGGQTAFNLSEISYDGKKLEIISSVTTDGFRYDSEKYACDDMYFSLDATYKGYDIFLDSYIWCTHLHNQWDTNIIGER